MTLKQRPNLIAVLLASCLSGIVLAPLLYIAIGALGGFSIQFSYLILPIYLLSGGYLLWRFYSTPTPHQASLWQLVLESICLFLVIAFLAVISGFRLLTISERIGLSATFFLLTTTLSFPIIYLRTSALLSRIEKRPKIIAGIVAAGLLLPAAIAAAYFSLQAPAFL